MALVLPGCFIEEVPGSTAKSDWKARLRAERV